MEQHGVSRAAPEPEPVHAVDVAFGVLAQAAAAVAVVTGPLQTIARPLAHVVLQPPLLPPRLQPATWVSRVAQRGAAYRREAAHELDALVDLVTPALVSEMVRRVDLTDLVQKNVDLVTVAREVIAEIDLPEIIRDSTGAVASETLLGVRMQSISGDDAIRRVVDRLRLRLARRVAATHSPEPLVPDGQPMMVVSARLDGPAGTT